MAVAGRGWLWGVTLLVKLDWGCFILFILKSFVGFGILLGLFKVGLIV